MDTTPSRRKPATPPKPLARFSGTGQDEKKAEEITDRYESGGVAEGIGTKTSSAKHNSLPPKPALLPKPQSPLKPCIRGRPQFPRHSDPGRQDHPTIKPKNPVLSLLTLKAPVAKLDEFEFESCGPSLGPVRPPRSPKIKLFPEGPFKTVDMKPELPLKKRLGPARSTGAADSKDWENVKKRSSSLGRMGNTSLLEKSLKSLSLSRNISPSEAFSASDGSVLTSADVKIGPVPPPRRHKKGEETLSCAEDTPLPVAAPSCTAVPVYAQVNYEMKKNRRALANLPVASSPPEDSVKESTMPVLTGQLLLTGNKVERNNFIRLVEPTQVSIEMLSADSIEVNANVHREDKGDTLSGGSPEPITLCDLISKDKIELGVLAVIPAQQCIGDNTDEASTVATCEEIIRSHLLPRQSALHCIMRSPLQVPESVPESDGTDAPSIMQGSPLQVPESVPESDGTDAPSIMQGSPLQVPESDGTDAPSIMQGSPLQVPESDGTDAPSIMQGSPLQVPESDGTDAPSNEGDKVSAQIVPRKSQLYHLQEFQASRHDITSSTVYSSYCVSEPEHPSHVTQDYMPSATHTIVAVENHTKDIEPVVQRQCEDIDYSTTYTKEPYTRPPSKLEVTEVPSLLVTKEELVIQSASDSTSEVTAPPTGSVGSNQGNEAGLLWRRQSWSSSKDTTPSPDCHAARKQKHSSAPWCDDGEISNGALADSDTGSSDNVGKKSLEDVANGNGPYFRNKVASWFDSFGKGSKRKERKMRAMSREEKQSSSTGSSKSLVREGAETRSVTSDIGSLRPQSAGAQVERSPSGISSILDSMEQLTTLDADALRDSESDNEEPAKQVASPLSEEQRKERKVFLIAEELMTSERHFVEVLKLLNMDFIAAINASGTREHPVIPHQELFKIINSLPQLQRLNEEILRDLQLRIKNWTSNPKIADVIVKKGPFLKLYSSYIQNFETQCNYLDECCLKYPQFGKVVKTFESLPICKKLEVKHFMLKPVQRIPQYRLLLEDYQRHLDSTSSDWEDTATALKIVREVADHANRTIKLGDHLNKLIDLQSQLINHVIIKPGRVYLKDGELFKLSRKERHPRYFILLSDCLLYTTRLSTSFLRVNKELPLDGMKVFIPQVEDNLNEFNIISVTRSFTLSASSLGERREWIDALDSAIKDHACRKLTFLSTGVDGAPSASEAPRLGHRAPVWIQDARVTMCQSCTTPFTVMFRRHHCRACGKVVCGHCSDNRAPLRYKSFQSERVCEDCHQTLLQEFEGPESQSILQDIMTEGSFKDLQEAFEVTKTRFKKSGSGTKKKILLLRKDIPQRLKEVAANDSGSQMSGWLQRRGRHSWKRLWFVLKEQVLYVYKASEDVVALESIPILGYKVEPMTERHFQIYEGIDATLVFQLAHPGQLPLVFHADSQYLAERWMSSMGEATVLH